jgi:hypothetical protein
MPLARRTFLLAAPALLAGCAEPKADPHAHAAHNGMFERLNAPGRVDRPVEAAIQNVFDSPAPKPRAAGRWMAQRTRCPCRAARWPGRWP